MLTSKIGVLLASKISLSFVSFGVSIFAYFYSTFPFITVLGIIYFTDLILVTAMFFVSLDFGIYIPGLRYICSPYLLETEEIVSLFAGLELYP